MVISGKGFHLSCFKKFKFKYLIKKVKLCSASTWKNFWQQLQFLLVLQLFLLNSILKNYVKLFDILI